MEEIIECKLNGGLCNKLFHLFSICDIAIKEEKKILEPYFGWKRKILFSDIYDINFFNDSMKKINNNNNLIIPITEKEKYKIIKNNIDLWEFSNSKLRIQRRQKKINNIIMINVLNSLKLNKNNLNLLKKIKNINTYNSIHIRIENDWINYRKIKNKLFIDECQIIKMYKNKFNSNVFFTCGENQTRIKKKFTENKINSMFFFDNNLEYEINAAINFELCCKSNIFIGLTSSTFSNLITLKRALLNNDNSYIYNYNNQIIKRIDKGLYPDPIEAINNNALLL